MSMDKKKKTDAKPVYLCDLHADACGFRTISFTNGGMRCQRCGQEATHICDSNTPENEVNDD